MAYLVQQEVSLTGREVVSTSASVAGDTFSPGDRSFFLVKNDSGASVTLVFDDPNSEGPTAATSFDPDVTFVTAPNTTNLIGPFSNARFASSSDGFVHVTYSAVTSVTVASLKLAS